jgi:HSP20 family protein
VSGPRGASAASFSWAKTSRPDNVTALYDFGVLTVTVPVAASAKPRKIRVTWSSAEHTAISSSATEG